MEIEVYDRYYSSDDLLELFCQGYYMHKSNRPDKFINRDKERLSEILNFTLEKNSIIIARDNNKVIGFLIYDFQQKVSKTLWVDEIIVDTGYQNQGVGNALMSTAEKVAKENDCSGIELCCWTFNQNAKKFYDKLGYVTQRAILEKKI